MGRVRCIKNPMENDQTAELLGQRIRGLRKAKGLTQEDLGAKCGVNYKYVGAIERGEENPSLSTLEKMAKGLGVEIYDLFRFHHEEKDPVKLKKELINNIKRIAKEETETLQTILKLVNALR